MLLICLVASFPLLARVELPFLVEEYNTVNENLDVPAEYYNIKRVTIEEIAPAAPNYVELKSTKDVSDIIFVIEKLIALGTKVWTIIEDNRAVVTTNLGSPISVLPYFDDDNILDFSRLSNWSMPTVKSYRVAFINGFEEEVATFEYSIHFQYNGIFKGAGKYITGLSVVANEASASWGYTLNAVSELVAISNHGSVEDPLAGATIQVGYTLETVFKKTISTVVFHVTGDGQLVRIN